MALFFRGFTRVGGSVIIGTGRRGGMMILGFLMTGWTSLRAGGLVSSFFGYGVCLSRIAGTLVGPYALSCIATRAPPGAGGGGGDPPLTTIWGGRGSGTLLLKASARLPHRLMTLLEVALMN
jgi:hypothetical protein